MERESTTDIFPLFTALADAQRIKVIAPIVDGSLTMDEIAEAAGMPVKVVMKHLARLQQAGLIDLREEKGTRRYRFRQNPLFEALKRVSERPPEPELEGDVDAFDRKVLTDFLEDGRLKAIPSQHKKREAVLRYLVLRFEPERMYEEREVNEIIKPLHDDYASLRRYLIDEGYLKRQIVTQVDAEELIEGGAPKPELRVLYWKPGASEPGAGEAL